MKKMILVFMAICIMMASVAQSTVPVANINPEPVEKQDKYDWMGVGVVLLVASFAYTTMGNGDDMALSMAGATVGTTLFIFGANRKTNDFKKTKVVEHY